MLDLECSKCGTVLRDVFFRNVPKVIRHSRADTSSKCKGKMEQVFLPSTRGGQWGDRDAVVVFKKPDGSISYPARNDLPTPKGCERVVMRSLNEVNRFERENNVCCEAMHFNRGNEHPVVDRLPHGVPYADRLRSFMESYRG